MKALIWKECRENVYKLATGLGVVLLLHVLRYWEAWNMNAFSKDLSAWALAVCGLCAGVLAMDAVAGERSRGTLEFLLVRPTTTARILLAKYVVGAGGLLIVVTAFWAMVYVKPIVEIEGHGLVPSYLARLLADIGLLPMVYAWFLPLLVVYTVIFMTSTATENSAEAAGAGGLIGLIAVFLLMLAHFLYPKAEYTWTAVWDLIDVPLDSHGDLLRIALRPSAVIARTLLAAALVTLGFVAALTITNRFREFTVGRRTLVVSAFVLVAMFLAVPRLLSQNTDWIRPIGTLRFDTATPGMSAPKGQPRGLVLHRDHAFTFGRDSLLVVDVSAPEHPTQVASTPRPRHWSLTQPVLVAENLCTAGRRAGSPTDSVAVFCADISEPRAPRMGEPLIIEVSRKVSYAHDGEGDDGIERLVAHQPFHLLAVGDILVLGTTSNADSRLTSLTIGTDGSLRWAHELVTGTRPSLDRDDYSDEAIRIRATWRDYRYWPVAGGGHLYLGLQTGVQVIEVNAGGRLALGEHVDVGGGQAWSSRHMVLRGDTLWVDRHWPREKVSLDVSDPGQPRLLDAHPNKTRHALAFGSSFFYQSSSRGVRLYDAAHMYPRRIPTLALEEERPPRVRAVVLRDGYAYTLMGDRLAVFRLPDRKGS